MRVVRCRKWIAARYVHVPRFDRQQSSRSLASRPMEHLAQRVEKVPSHLTAAVDDPDDFRGTLGAEETLGLIAARWKGFSAALTQVRLDGLRLLAIDENIPRIALVAVPADKALILFLNDGRSSQVWGGVRMQDGDLVTVGPGQVVHARIDGPCHWGAVWSATTELVRYSRALNGEPLTLPCGVCRWRPRRAAARKFRQLVASIVRTARDRPGSLVEAQIAHGIEQQLIHALIACLTGGPDCADGDREHLHHHIMVDLETMLQARVSEQLRAPDIGPALGVSDRVLRRCCDECLGMSPKAYHHLRRMHLARHALQDATPGAARVSQVAERFGFRNTGRFTASYRALFGELPSRTLARARGSRVKHDRDASDAGNARLGPLIDPDQPTAGPGLLE